MSRISKEQTELRWRMVRAGKSDSEIAEACGVKPDTIRTWKSYHGIKERSAAELETERRRIAMFEQGLSFSEIARREGVSSISSWFYRRGYHRDKGPVKKTVNKGAEAQARRENTRAVVNDELTARGRGMTYGVYSLQRRGYDVRPRRYAAPEFKPLRVVI